MYMYSTRMQSGSLHLHVVNAVPVLSIVPALKVVTIVIVERLLHKVWRHIVAIPIERIVAIVLMLLQARHDIVT